MGSASDDPKRKKEMDGVAKHMRFTITVKKAIIKGENVEYFPGDIYVALVESLVHLLRTITGIFGLVNLIILVRVYKCWQHYKPTCC